MFLLFFRVAFLVCRGAVTAFLKHGSMAMKQLLSGLINLAKDIFNNESKEPKEALTTLNGTPINSLIMFCNLITHCTVEAYKKIPSPHPKVERLTL